MPSEGFMASKRRIRRKACGSKQKFSTAKAAGDAAFGLQRRKGYSGPINTYRCPHCKQYHWGHNSYRPSS